MNDDPATKLMINPQDSLLTEIPLRSDSKRNTSLERDRTSKRRKLCSPVGNSGKQVKLFSEQQHRHFIFHKVQNQQLVGYPTHSAINARLIDIEISGRARTQPQTAVRKIYPAESERNHKGELIHVHRSKPA
jgi:hypothetical protein